MTMTGALAQMTRPRGGRPRNARSRTDGRLPDVPPDYRQLIALQPHRRGLHEAHRLSEKAESPLGRLNLRGIVSDEQREAGRIYAAITGAYRGSIGAPHGTAGGGGYGCAGDCVKPELCECLRRKRAYDDAYEALWDAGQRAAKAVAHVAVRECEPDPSQIPHLLWGLSALVKHFGLTNRGKSCQR